VSKHTPGPWVARVGKCTWAVNALPDKGDCLAYHEVAQDERTLKPEDKANAWLVAAAPSLFDACRQFVNAIETNDQVELGNALQSARSAVDEATTGRDPGPHAGTRFRNRTPRK
jgi:hypothetical protein